MKSSAALIVLNIIVLSCTGDQTVNYIAKYLDVTFNILDNESEEVRWIGRFDLLNTGTEPIQAGSWAIRFCFIRILEPDDIMNEDGAVLGDSGFTAFHINGCLYKLKPNVQFSTLNPGHGMQVFFTAGDWQVARTDCMPNWYVVNDDDPSQEPKVIVSTAGEDLGFVPPLTEPKQYKRTDYDLFGPYSAEERYDRYLAADLGAAPYRVLPQPVEASYIANTYIDLSGGDWLVVAEPSLQNEADYFAETLDTTVVSSAPSSRYIHLILDANVALPEQCMSPNDKGQEGYHLLVNTTDDIVTITGKSGPAVLHGVHTFLSLMDDTAKTVPGGEVKDCPRFQYRGLHIDTSRNFFQFEHILKIIDAIARYKLNKLHFHLTDDEGWRLEIPGLEELTTVGATRCQDADEDSDRCILPQLGSNPGGSGAGSGFYSVTEYKQILQYAQDRHIEVIPEFDFPGHAHAAVNAMEARYHKNIDSNPDLANQYRLIDPNDQSKYLSIQLFTDNAVDVCGESTYNFMQKVAEGIVDIHKDIQPLKVLHFGGDEVPATAWGNSSYCEDLKESNPNIPWNATNKQLKEYFVQRVSNISNALGLDLMMWEDGVMGDGEIPYDTADLVNNNVYANAWSNIWEWGTGSRLYKLANAGYKGVISHATHLYFDHPNEPDPEERGYYWATRFTDTIKTFSFIPDNIYDNIEIDRFGRPLDPSEICQLYGCPDLQEPDNIVGMQGHLWSETVRNGDQLDAMLFPRVLALAERAWHKASWEDEADKTRKQKMRVDDWQNFANTLGYRELSRLDKLGINYHVRPPGIKLNEISVDARAEFPGLDIRITTDGGATYQDYSPNMAVRSGSEVSGIVRSADRSRESLPSMNVMASGATCWTISGLTLMATYIIAQAYISTGYN